MLEGIMSRSGLFLTLMHAPCALRAGVLEGNWVEELRSKDYDYSASAKPAIYVNSTQRLSFTTDVRQMCSSI